MNDTELAARIAQLEARLALLERTTPRPPSDPSEPSASRRELLRKGGLAAAGLAVGAVASVAAARPASAAAPVVGISATDDGVYGETSAGSGKAGVHGVSTNGGSYGVLAEITGGVPGTALMAKTDGNGLALNVQGVATAMQVYSTAVFPTAVVANPTAGGFGLDIEADNPLTFHKRREGNPADGATFGEPGSFVRFEGPGSTDLNPVADLWACVAQDGGYGVFRKLAGISTAGTLHVLPAPVRVYDSRPGTSPAVGSKTPLAANATRDIDCSTGGAVPPGATTALVNVTATDTVGSGWLALYEPSATYAGTSSLNWSSTGQSVANTTVCALSPAGLIRVRAGGNTTDFLIDVVGYYI